MIRAIGGNRVLQKQILRFLSRKKDDTAILADALNLLSPKLDNFKPSLISSLTKGSVDEQYKNQDFYRVQPIQSSIHQDYVHDLLNNLSYITKTSLNSQDLLNMNDKELISYIKTIPSESELLQVYNLLYQHQKLSFKHVSMIILNRNLKNLNSLNLNDIFNNDEILHAQLQILLLKKYHDLSKPLLIIKNLKLNFQTYLNLIQSKKLLPFYERIVWKFNFQYIKQYDEFYYIEKLNNLRSSILIWESTTNINNFQIVERILKFDLNDLQNIFFRLLMTKSIQNKVSQQLLSNNSSALLSNFKKISIKFKIHNVSTNKSKNDHYNLIKSLESIIYNELIGTEKDNSDLIEILSDLKQFKQYNLMGKQADNQDLKWIDNVINA